MFDLMVVKKVDSIINGPLFTSFWQLVKCGPLSSGAMVEWLDLIPAAILSALLLPALITTGEPKYIDLFQPRLLVAIPTFFFALKTKSLGGTVIFGMVLYWLADKVI